MITLAKFSIKDVLPFAGRAAPKRIYCVQDIKYKIKMNSLRYQTFKKSLNCVYCGLTGDFFLLQCLSLQETPHFNLYHSNFDDELVLMTKDHIQPKSKGGLDHIDNLQTLCFNCNIEKSDRYIE